MSTHTPPLLMLKAVTAVRGNTTLLHPSTFSVVAGERIAILGPNGAGKSTLLKRIAGLIGGGGTISLLGADRDTLSLNERAKCLAYLPQECMISGGVSAEQVVTLGRLPHGVDLDDPSADDQAAISAAMLALRVEKWRARALTTLSTGERARVLVARAIASQSPLLLADEPVSSLDPYHQVGVLTALADYAAQGRAVLAVMHDLTLAAQWASRVLLVEAGHVIYDGNAGEALSPARLDPLFGIKTICLPYEKATVISYTAD